MKNLIFIFSLFFSLSLYAADLAKLENLFRRSFWSSLYQDNYCGQNIENFVRLAIKERINLDGAKIVEITNGGTDMFGLVAALQAREGGGLIRPERATPPFRMPGEENWHFHAILIADNKVFDFDFTNQAAVLNFLQYLDEQFVPVAKRSSNTYKWNKLANYRLSLFPAVRYIQLKDRRESTSGIKEEGYIKDLYKNYVTPPWENL